MDLNIPPTTVNLNQPATPIKDDHSSSSLTTDSKRKKRNDEFRERITTCRNYRRKLITSWGTSIDYLRGKPFASQSDSDQIAVNLDWALTKAKKASLFSQVPEVRVNHGEDLLLKSAPWVTPFQKKLNDTMNSAGIESAMDECLSDLINASGFATIMVSYESLQEDVELPLQPEDPNSPKITIPRDTDHRYLVQRLSPSDFLWPTDFTGSDFDKAPWIGRSGRITWAEAVQQFKLLQEDKDKILGEDRPMMDKLTHDRERDKLAADDKVGFDEIFYHEFSYDSEAKSYSSIRRLVFITGKDDPVIDEPWKGQKSVEGTTIVGAQHYPIRVLTLAYITDEAIPPSDSAIGRPQVNEINKARTQWIHQRERSIPIRTADINRIDPVIMQSLMRGTWQNIIPVQGDGSRIITEVARANISPESFKFNDVAMGDLNREWTEPALSGADVETKGESSNLAQSANLPRVRERARVASFVTSIAMVVGGLLCLFEDPSTFGQGFDPSISKQLTYSILADSTIVLDANQKLSRLNNFVETYAKSGWVNLEPVLQEIAILSGLDPSTVIVPPKPKPPESPNISLRLTGAEDLLNPLVLAFMINSGQAPTADQIQQAKSMIQTTVEPMPGLQMPSSVQPAGGLPMLPTQQLPSTTMPPIGTVPPPAPPPVGEANPHLAALEGINKRTESGGNQ